MKVFRTLVDLSVVTLTMAAEKDELSASQLIDTLQFLSPMSSGFKYDRYGCHCFQNGLTSSDFSGKGPALDQVDGACQRLHQCQRCLSIDLGKSCDHTVAYKIRYDEDPVTLARTATCLDKPGTCGRNLCDCSIAFAQSMAAAEESGAWDVNLSKYSGDKSYREQCESKSPSAHKAKLMAPVVLKSAGNGSDEGQSCCGSYGKHRFPYESTNRGCCGGKTYDQKWLRCCKNKIVSISSQCE